MIRNNLAKLCIHIKKYSKSVAFFLFTSLLNKQISPPNGSALCKTTQAINETDLCDETIIPIILFGKICINYTSNVHNLLLILLH